MSSSKRLRSANITQGPARAPNRSMYYALGYKEEDFNKPMVGVANGHSTITPCNSGLQKLRSEEHTSELQSLMRISYAVFCLKKQINSKQKYTTQTITLKYT